MKGTIQVLRRHTMVRQQDWPHHYLIFCQTDHAVPLWLFESYGTLLKLTRTELDTHAAQGVLVDMYKQRGRAERELEKYNGGYRCQLCRWAANRFQRVADYARNANHMHRYFSTRRDRNDYTIVKTLEGIVYHTARLNDSLSEYKDYVGNMFADDMPNTRQRKNEKRHVSAPVVKGHKEGAPVVYESKQWELAEEAIKHGHVLLYGPPGTGKTYLAQTPLDEEEVYSITCTDEMSSTSLLGYDRFVNGSQEWVFGPGTLSWNKGARFTVNELDQASGDVLASMYNITDDAGVARLTLPTGQTITPQPGFRCVATMNPDPMVLPEALLDRFMLVKITDPSPAALTYLPVSLQEPALRYCLQTDRSRRTSLRPWFRFASLVEVEVPARIAAELAFPTNTAAMKEAAAILVSIN